MSHEGDLKDTGPGPDNRPGPSLLFRIYRAGIAILVGAIIMNVAAGALGLATWYTFLTAAGRGAAAAVRSLRAVDWLFLLIIYPGLLGACAYPVLRT
jgi:hypothetical protein